MAYSLSTVPSSVPSTVSPVKVEGSAKEDGEGGRGSVLCLPLHRVARKSLPSRFRIGRWHGFLFHRRARRQRRNNSALSVCSCSKEFALNSFGCGFAALGFSARFDGSTGLAESGPPEFPSQQSRPPSACRIHHSKFTIPKSLTTRPLQPSAFFRIFPLTSILISYIIARVW